ncbi:limbic system-associated membrane protein [Procambarus clarkii]|uniref:limbic system-associated membrane protein n=1 Tax=Procambarus clarkii TaxID=6728 RepID=UPI001E676411|nr:junctional adhesion molecule B-like [Procambarus clarkii]XP_045596147.1 junctional adhesion molecule B-like [Procambarus clarkii]
MGPSLQPLLLPVAVATLLVAVAGDGVVGPGQLEVEVGGGALGGGVGETVANNSHVNVLPGEDAKLACPIPSDVYGSRVSWLRRKDMQLLAISEMQYTSDHRIFVSHSRHSHKKDSRHTQMWFLHIRNVTKNDEGEYECQTSTHPPMSFMTFLKVQTARSEMQGSAERMVAAGSSLQLVCTFKDASNTPPYVFWYQDSRMINYDTARGVHINSDQEHSILTVSSVLDEHAGNYTCSPANASPSSVLVHVVVETTDPGLSRRGQKEVGEAEKTPVRQLGVKSASSAGPRVLPQTLALFLLALLLLDALTFPRVFQRSL